MCFNGIFPPLPLDVLLLNGTDCKTLRLQTMISQICTLSVYNVPLYVCFDFIIILCCKWWYLSLNLYFLYMCDLAKWQTSDPKPPQVHDVVFSSWSFE